jgi:hypothetical protein
MLDQAYKLEIPTDELLYKGDPWVVEDETNAHLTLEVRDKLRELIRKERRVRLEDRMLWVSHVIAPLTGLVGATIGLLAFLRSCK